MTADTLKTWRTEAGADALAVAWHDFATDTGGQVHGGRWFHAASTMKMAVLAAVFAAAEAGRFDLGAPLHVRNRFFSLADGTPFRVASRRDANATVYQALGQTLPVRTLALHMITTSSNLATNLLLDLVGVEAIQAGLQRWGVAGIDVRRGVEDEKAFEADLNNRVTANGLVALCRALYADPGFSEAARAEMLDILKQQRFRRGIPAGLPEEIRGEAAVAHKTGEISTIAHDAGLVFLPDRAPYALAVLTAWPADRKQGRSALIARTSRLVYDHLTAAADA